MIELCDKGHMTLHKYDFERYYRPYKHDSERARGLTNTTYSSIRPYKYVLYLTAPSDLINTTCSSERARRAYFRSLRLLYYQLLSQPQPLVDQIHFNQLIVNYKLIRVNQL